MTCVDLDTVLAVFNNMKRAGVKYSFGAKAPNLDADSHTITEIDCSGFVRFVLHRAANGGFTMPDGSVNQREWIEAHGWHELNQYSDVQYAKDDPTRLFIAFLDPKGNKPGHVWLIRGGVTMESHGGVGVDSRPWNTPALRNAQHCFVVPAC